MVEERNCVWIRGPKSYTNRHMADTCEAVVYAQAHRHVHLQHFVDYETLEYDGIN